MNNRITDYGAATFAESRARVLNILVGCDGWAMRADRHSHAEHSSLYTSHLAIQRDSGTDALLYRDVMNTADRDVGEG
ncbi:hypothetical protein [Pseudomonas viridiflava]|uniref:hypothetical protein n=1 Tax=Pseudomonas syringae group TaxID=136849 RepID=UPI0013CEE2C9|nr:hypothetical protein [Pseudomonas viridiflava]